MKILTTLFYVLLLSISFGCHSVHVQAGKPPEHLAQETASNQGSISSGERYLTADQLLKKYGKFQSKYQEYTPSEEAIARLRSIKQPLTLWLVYGTWCHDSEREVPLIIKLLKQANNPNLTLHLVDVGYDKKVKGELGQSLKIRYTPTLIVTGESKHELLRIVERPQLTWDQDIAQAANIAASMVAN